MVRICAGAKFHDSAVTTYGIQLRAWVDMQVPFVVEADRSCKFGAA